MCTVRSMGIYMIEANDAQGREETPNESQTERGQVMKEDGLREENHLMTSNLQKQTNEHTRGFFYKF